VSPLARLLTWLVRGYQLVLSPLFGPRCRFYPSCSSYAVQALSTHGALRGTWLAGRRLLRCHPWNPGGVDHVPPPGARRTDRSANRATDHHTSGATAPTLRTR
jgi:uncharacterized protein